MNDIHERDRLQCEDLSDGFKILRALLIFLSVIFAASTCGLVMVVMLLAG